MRQDRRQEYNIKKRGRELQKKKQQKTEVIGYKILFVVMFLLAIIAVLTITVWTENPLLLMGSWGVLYDRLCIRNMYTPNKMKKMLYIPIMELIFGVGLLALYMNGSLSFIDFIGEYGIGMIILVLILCSFLNGAIYFYYNWTSKR